MPIEGTPFLLLQAISADKKIVVDIIFIVVKDKIILRKESVSPESASEAVTCNQFIVLS
jgi:hypothetical protein